MRYFVGERVPFDTNRRRGEGPVLGTKPLSILVRRTCHLVPIAKGRKCQWACRGHLTREVFFVRRQCHLVPIIKEKNRPMTLSWGPILGGEKVKIALSCVPNAKDFVGKSVIWHQPREEGANCPVLGIKR